MKILRNVTAAVLRVCALPVVKYIAIVVTGIVLVVFVGENSLLAHLRYTNHIGELSDEIDEYTAHYENDMRQIRELNRNPKAMERIARERYFMKHDDEDIFVLSDDPRDPHSIVNDHETAE